MGNRLDGFDINLTFGPTGEVDKIEYVDQEGCGKSSVITADDRISDVVRYHLDHYDRSHDMRPEPRCGFETHAHFPGMLGAHLWLCVSEPHAGNVPHTFEVVPGS